MNLLTVLKELGVDFTTPFDYRDYRFYAGAAMMPLTVELWNDGQRDFIAVAHYGVQNGDAMADPDMLFEYANGELLPVHYQNDYVGVFQRCREYEESKVMVNPKLDLELRTFANSWAHEITINGYAVKKEAGPPA